METQQTHDGITVNQAKNNGLTLLAIANPLLPQNEEWLTHHINSCSLIQSKKAKMYPLPSFPPGKKNDVEQQGFEPSP